MNRCGARSGSIQCRRGHWRDALASYNKLLAIKAHDAVALATAATSCTSYIAPKTR
jgi:hypothetical protein